MTREPADRVATGAEPPCPLCKMSRIFLSRIFLSLFLLYLLWQYWRLRLGLAYARKTTYQLSYDPTRRGLGPLKVYCKNGSNLVDLAYAKKLNTDF